jgi:hypothetical protein
MPAIMPDNDVRGHLQMPLRICRSSDWLDVWNQLQVEVVYFEELQIAEDACDRDVWLACQSRDVVLITGNRNADGPDSLEATIADLCTASSLPGLTIGQPQRVYGNREYAELVAVKLMELLLDLNTYRGTGRLYLP